MVRKWGRGMPRTCWKPVCLCRYAPGSEDRHLKSKAESDWGRYPTLASYLHMCAHVHMYTPRYTSACTHTKTNVLLNPTLCCVYQQKRLSWLYAPSIEDTNSVKLKSIPSPKDFALIGIRAFGDLIMVMAPGVRLLNPRQAPYKEKGMI